MIDACVPIDLNEGHVNYLQEILELLRDDTLFISSVNYNEIKDRSIRTLLERSTNVEIVSCEDEKFERFSGTLESSRINLSKNDRYVLFLAVDKSADFVVSSDMNVIEKVSRYRKLASVTHLNPITTVGLLKYVSESNMVRPDILLEKSLNLFKYKEIENILHYMENENLHVSRERQLQIINDYIGSLKERFQVYKDPLLIYYRDIFSSQEA